MPASDQPMRLDEMDLTMGDMVELYTLTSSKSPKHQIAARSVFLFVDDRKHQLPDFVFFDGRNIFYALPWWSGRIIVKFDDTLHESNS